MRRRLVLTSASRFQARIRRVWRTLQNYGRRGFGFRYRKKTRLLRIRAGSILYRYQRQWRSLRRRRRISRRRKKILRRRIRKKRRRYLRRLRRRQRKRYRRRRKALRRRRLRRRQRRRRRRRRRYRRRRRRRRRRRKRRRCVICFRYLNRWRNVYKKGRFFTFRTRRGFKRI